MALDAIYTDSFLCSQQYQSFSIQLYQLLMNQPHPDEEPWEAKRLREVVEKKLFALHSENERLRAQQEEFQIAIQDYVRKIDLFNEKSLFLEQENQKLKDQVQSLNGKNKKVEGLLNKRNEQYCSLYNYLFTEKRGAIQDVFFKEMDLNNKLNQIQHQSDTQIIQKLKSTIRSKNQELLKYVQRISELNDALANSTFEYQQQINTLRFEKKRLEEASLLQQREPSNLSNQSDDYFSNKKIEGLQQQINLYKQELKQKQNEIQQVRKRQSQIQNEKESIERELDQLKYNRSEFDGNIYNVMSQNNKLKLDLEKERIKNAQLLQYSPEFSGREFEINNYFDFKANQECLKNANKKLKLQKQCLSKIINQQKAEIQTLNTANKQLQLKLHSLKIISTSSFNKMMKVIQAYAPYYYRKEKLAFYNLDEEEINFVNEQHIDLTLLHIKKEIDQRVNEIAQLKQKQRKLEEIVNEQKEKIDNFEKEVAQKDRELKKLFIALSSVKARKNREFTQVQSEINADEEDVDGGNQEYNPYNDRQLSLPQQGDDKIRVRVLETAIQSLQNDRNELIGIIKCKDVNLIELTAEINVLKKMQNIVTLNLHSFQSKGLGPLRQYQSQEQYSNNQQKESSSTEISEIREELRHLSIEHKEEKQLLIIQFERKQAEQLNKYILLLKKFDELTVKYTALQSTVSSQKQESIQIEMQNQEIINDNPVEIHPQNEIIHQQHDHNAISESAIENFTDILKKYEREFNKYVTIYENQIKKSLDNAMVNEQAEVTEQNQHIYSGEHIEQLENLINQHFDTIKHLESLLEEKGKQSDIQTKELASALQEAKNTITELNNRWDQANITISGLKSQVLEQKTKLDFGSEESSNSIFSILNLKNKQIDSLKNTHESLKKQYEEKCKEIAKLREKSFGHTEFEAEEYRVLKKIMQDEDLLGVLEGAIEHLQ